MGDDSDSVTHRDWAGKTSPFVVQASRLPEREMQAGRLHHNHEVAKVIFARALLTRSITRLRSYPIERLPISR